MLALAAALALQNSDLPEKAVVAYSGIPTVTGQNIVVQSHSVTLLLKKDHAEVSSLTLIKNDGPAGTAAVTIPEFQSVPGAPSFAIAATWANAPLTLSREQIMGIPENRNPTWRFSGKGPMKNLGTYALRISYSVPLGKCGFDHKQFLAAYDLNSPAPIGTLMTTYTYGPGVVFHEPEAAPNLGWQVGQKGAFLRLNGYDGKGGLSYCAFYSGGFK
ncbi:MAG TPA: hypothetical protein VHE55_11075 [Fimbriimonadaceae bacterium]|nr:hypothetical protein [Fimbriimonadaceae bacterium]